MPNNYYTSSSPPPFPLHLFIFLLTLLLFIFLQWYLNYESALRKFTDQLRLLVIASPLALLLAVHWLSAAAGNGRRSSPVFALLPEDREALRRAGGSPAGVGAVLCLLLLMVSYQSYFHMRWFPLVGRH